MANRRFNQFGLALENRIVHLFARVAIGATGAPTLNTAKSKGVASIIRNSAGNYTITLQDQYVDLFSVVPTLTFASGSPASGAAMVVRAQAVASDKTVEIEFLDGSFAATDLADGVILGLMFVMKDSVA